MAKSDIYEHDSSPRSDYGKICNPLGTILSVIDVTEYLNIAHPNI